MSEPFRRVSGPTRRLAILGAVAVLLALMLVPTVRAWLDQRTEIAALRGKVSTQEESLRALQEEELRWSDPAYVEQQARRRLKFVKPGEVAYTVIGADAMTRARQGEVHGSVLAPADSEQMPWYAQLWTSVELTDGIGRGTTRLDGGRVPTPSLFPTTTPSQTPSPPQTVPDAERTPMPGTTGSGPAPRSGGAPTTPSTAVPTSAPGFGR